MVCLFASTRGVRVQFSATLLPRASLSMHHHMKLNAPPGRNASAIAGVSRCPQTYRSRSARHGLRSLLALPSMGVNASQLSTRAPASASISQHGTQAPASNNNAQHGLRPQNTKLTFQHGLQFQMKAYAHARGQQTAGRGSNAGFCPKDRPLAKGTNRCDAAGKDGRILWCRRGPARSPHSQGRAWRQARKWHQRGGLKVAKDQGHLVSRGIASARCGCTRKEVSTMHRCPPHPPSDGSISHPLPMHNRCTLPPHMAARAPRHARMVTHGAAYQKPMSQM